MDIAIRFAEYGDPGVLRVEPIEPASPAADEVTIRQYAAGVNFIDTYHRRGIYPVSLPSGIGLEGAGEVIACGSAVTDFAVGDRVAYCGGPLGGYADVRTIPATFLVSLPESISYTVAASIMLQGLTACCWVREVYPISSGDTVLIHAAAGGVGLLLVQWAKMLGATVIGTCSTEEKAELARTYGCDHTILYTKESFANRVAEITHGVGVDVVYDSVGKDTFWDSLKCLKTLGTMVSFGNATGPVPPVSLLEVCARVPVYLIRPSVFQLLKTAKDRRRHARDLLTQVLQGHIRPRIGATYPLREAAIAHYDLEARKTTGSIVLLTSRDQ